MTRNEAFVHAADLAKSTGQYWFVFRSASDPGAYAVVTRQRSEELRDLGDEIVGAGWPPVIEPWPPTVKGV